MAQVAHSITRRGARSTRRASRAARILPAAASTMLVLLLLAAPAGAAPVFVSDAGFDAVAPAAVTTDQAGRTHIAWRGQTADYTGILYSVVSRSGVPSTPIPLAPDGLTAYSPSIAADAAGAAHVVWSYLDGTTWKAQYTTVATSGAAGPVITVPGPGQNTSLPDVAVDASGTAHIAWVSNEAAMTTYVKYATVSPAGVMSSPISVSAAIPDADMVQVEIATTGVVHIAWAELTGATNLLGYATVTGGIASAPQHINDPAEVVYSPALAVDRRGVAHLAWLAFDGADLRVKYTSVTNGSAAAETTVGPAFSSTGVGLAADSTGTAHVAWTSAETGHRVAHYASVTSEGAASAPVTLSDEDPTHDVWTVQVTVDASDHARVTWDETEPAETTTWTTEITGGVAGAAVPLSTMGGAAQQMDPHAVADTRDGLSVALIFEDGGKRRVQHTRIGPDPDHAPAALSFGSRDVHAGPTAVQTVTLTNLEHATTPITPAAPLITGPGAAAFSVTGSTCTAPLAPGASCAISLTFDPAAAASYTATLTARHAGSAITHTVLLAGTGTTPPPAGTTQPQPTQPGPEDPAPQPAPPSPEPDRSVRPCPAGTSPTVTCRLITPQLRARYGGGATGRGGLYMVGTAAGERFVGTGGADIIRGLGGADIVDARAGNDSVLGGGGADRLSGGAGSDTLYGEGGHDHIRGGAGHDRIDGGAGHDVLRGEGGHDRIDGGAGRDRIHGGAGNDRLYGGAGRDRIYGGAGNDRLYGGAAPDILYGQAGDDLLRGGRGRDLSLRGGTGRDAVRES